MSILVSTGSVESVVRYCCLCTVVFYNPVTFAMQKNVEQRYAIKFCVKLNKSATEISASLTKAYGDAIYWELWFLSGTKLSKRAEKMLKMTLVLEDHSRQRMIKMWKWCELWWRKTAEWVSWWLQDRQLITPATKMSWNDFKNGSSKSKRTLQLTGCCTTIMRQLTLRFQFENF